MTDLRLRDRTVTHGITITWGKKREHVDRELGTGRNGVEAIAVRPPPPPSGGYHQLVLPRAHIQ